MGSAGIVEASQETGSIEGPPLSQPAINKNNETTEASKKRGDWGMEALAKNQWVGLGDIHPVNRVVALANNG